MDASLFQMMESKRAAASHTVASSLAPRSGASLHAKNTLATGSASATSKVASAAATPKATSATDPSSTITSSDFLTLLVSELKNQDPTQPTDPNAYITQLVGVNSLEQLISINSGIGSLDSSVGTSTASSAAKPVSGTALQ